MDKVKMVDLVIAIGYTGRCPCLACTFVRVHAENELSRRRLGVIKRLSKVKKSS